MVDCDEKYIGESPRTLQESYKEHLKEPSPIHDHQNSTGHQTTMDNISIVVRRGMASPTQSKKPYTLG